MTTLDPAAGDMDEVLTPERERRWFASRRGPFEVFSAPELIQPPSPDDVTDEMLEQFLTYFDYSDLVDDTTPEAEVRRSIKEMSRASLPGIMSTVLFDQGGPQGMSLAWLWLGPNFKLFRHGHPLLGDCLYFVLAGSLHLGNTVLGPGGGFFVPQGMLYRYRAGSEGVQVLEIRAGVDKPLGSPATFKLGEPSVDAIRKLTDSLIQQRSAWAQPPSRIGEDAQANR